MNSNPNEKENHEQAVAAGLTPVTVIGLGMMGAALAEAFLKAGHPTTVWNRSVGKADTLVAKGAIRAATASEAVSASLLIVVCVLDYEAVDNILSPLGGLLAGRTLVNLTNGKPEQARKAVKWAAEQDANYLDGGIMAVPQMIAGPNALLLFSGSSEAFTTYQKELDVLGSGKYLGEDAGLAALYDLALLSAMYGMFAGFYHAVALVGTEKVEAPAFTALVVPWLQAMIASLPLQAQAMDANVHTTDVSSLYINKIGFVNLIEASQEQGISTELVAPIQALVERAVAEGYGADGLSRLAGLLKKP
ncbi:NAD(P)-dependent oxidoreductase [Paenibacillus elgii]|uniref:NAD(P)-dependent oxidoreductase n=1 Tax=Paenibacillus elgii TaxID=189691 RepID=UPI00203C97AE|nr:NAD(P)-binding domain-containing protein [Paenibacillus elgii]MCM3268681.1 NAD(P)-binding domain-containing protein [Paenibacillus elgii]